jgi:ceramide kinase
LFHTLQGHARSAVANLPPADLRALDGIIAVGGDGLFAEVLLGLTLQPQQALVGRLRLGHVPAGSTDAVACT